MSNKDIALSALNELGIKYELISHAPVHSIDDCSECEKRLNALMPRNLFLTTSNGKSFALLVLRPKAVFKTSSISRQAGMSRLSFAGEDKISEMLGAYPQAVSPLGLIFDKRHEVKLLMDEALLKEKSLLFHPLDSSYTVKIAMSDLCDKFLKNLNVQINTVEISDKQSE